jgi:guanylate kinase
MPPGELFILSAPSGTGKTTLIRSMMGGTADLGGLVFSVSHTTRSPRPGEVDGRDYHFVERSRFEAMIAAGRLLEHAEYNGHLYGTAGDEVLPRLAAGLDVILDIDVQGAEQVFRRYPAAIGVFVMPPSFAELRERLSGRGMEDEASRQRRLAVSLREMRRYGLYEHVIINDDAGRASAALAAILVARRHRRPRMEDRAEAILRDFEEAFEREPLPTAAGQSEG